MSETTVEAPLVDVDEARRLVGAGAVLIDVRSPEGRAKTGVIPGAVIADKQNLQVDAAPDAQIVVVCGSVNGSGPAAAELIGKGFVNVVHVDGGAPAYLSE